MKQTIIEAIDKEIADLRSAKAILLGSSEAAKAAPKRRGRPPGSGIKAKVLNVAKSKRGMSPEGKARIAAAQRKRWAAAKKAA